MNLKELLPIGSVVLLKDAKKKLMIFGIGQVNVDTKTVYDYIGVLYPEGSMGEGTQFLFNHDDIDQVIMRGFEDDERNKYIEGLQSNYDRYKKSTNGADE